MTGLAAFTFPVSQRPIRSVAVEDTVWFVARDVAEALEYSNPPKAIRDHVPAGHKRVNESFPHADLGLQPHTLLIDEAGLYRLIMRSHTPHAEAFQEWVTAEVLPAIRRTGAYAAPALPGTYLEALEALVASERARQETAVALAETAPKAAAWDDLADADGDFAVADAAKLLSRIAGVQIGRDRLFKLLDDLSLIYRQGGDRRWRPYQHAVDRGLLAELPTTREHPGTGATVLNTPQVRVTAKGLLRLHEHLTGSARALEGGHPRPVAALTEGATP